MRRFPLALVAVVGLVCVTRGLRAAERVSVTGVASASGTHKRPLLLVNDKRYELKPADTADASVAKTLDAISKGDTGT